MGTQWISGPSACPPPLQKGKAPKETNQTHGAWVGLVRCLLLVHGGEGALITEMEIKVFPEADPSTYGDRRSSTRRAFLFRKVRAETTPSRLQAVTRKPEISLVFLCTISKILCHPLRFFAELSGLIF